MVKPPACDMPGICTSSHWPGRNCTVGVKSQQAITTNLELPCLDGLFHLWRAGLQSQQTDVVIDLIYLVKYHGANARLSKFCSCALFMSQGCHRARYFARTISSGQDCCQRP